MALRAVGALRLSLHLRPRAAEDLILRIRLPSKFFSAAAGSSSSSSSSHSSYSSSHSSLRTGTLVAIAVGTPSASGREIVGGRGAGGLRAWRRFGSSSSFSSSSGSPLGGGNRVEGIGGVSEEGAGTKKGGSDYLGDDNKEGGGPLLLYKSPFADLSLRLKRVSLSTAVVGLVGLPILLHLHGGDVPAAGQAALAGTTLIAATGSTFALSYCFSPYVATLERIRGR